MLKIPHITRSVSSREVDTQLCQGTLCSDDPAQVGKYFGVSKMRLTVLSVGGVLVRVHGSSYLPGSWQRLLNNERLGGAGGDLSAMQNLANVYRPTLLNFINYFWGNGGKATRSY